MTDADVVNSYAKVWNAQSLYQVLLTTGYRAPTVSSLTSELEGVSREPDDTRYTEMNDMLHGKIEALTRESLRVTGSQESMQQLHVLNKIHQAMERLWGLNKPIAIGPDGKPLPAAASAGAGAAAGGIGSVASPLTRQLSVDGKVIDSKAGSSAGGDASGSGDDDSGEGAELKLGNLGLKAIIPTLILLLESCRRNDPTIVKAVVGIVQSVLADIKPNSLTAKCGFTSEVNLAIAPLFEFIRGLTNEKNADAGLARSLTSILFGLALARGSVKDLLELANGLLTNKSAAENVDELATFVHSLSKIKLKSAAGTVPPSLTPAASASQPPQTPSRSAAYPSSPLSYPPQQQQQQQQPQAYLPLSASSFSNLSNRNYVPSQPPPPPQQIYAVPSPYSSIDSYASFQPPQQQQMPYPPQQQQLPYPPLQQMPYPQQQQPQQPQQPQLQFYLPQQQQQQQQQQPQQPPQQQQQQQQQPYMVPSSMPVPVSTAIPNIRMPSPNRISQAPPPPQRVITRAINDEPPQPSAYLPVTMSSTSVAVTPTLTIASSSDVKGVPPGAAAGDLKQQPLLTGKDEKDSKSIPTVPAGDNRYSLTLTPEQALKQFAPDLASGKGLSAHTASMLIVSQLSRFSTAIPGADAKALGPGRAYFASADGRWRMYVDGSQDLRHRVISDSSQFNRSPQADEIFEIKWIDSTTFRLFYGNYQYRSGSSDTYPADQNRATATAEQTRIGPAETDRFYSFKIVSKPPSGVNRPANQSYLSCIQVNNRFINWQSSSGDRIMFRAPTADKSLFHICDAGKSFADNITASIAAEKAAAAASTGAYSTLEPFTYELQDGTFGVLQSLLTASIAGASAAAALPRDLQWQQTTLILSALKVLTAHLGVLTAAPAAVRSKLVPQSTIDSLWKLLSNAIPSAVATATKAPDTAIWHIMAVPISEASVEAIQSGFDLFFPSLTSQVQLLGDLIVKVLASTPANPVSAYQTSLLGALLKRFNELSLCVKLVVEAEDEHEKAAGAGGVKSLALYRVIHALLEQLTKGAIASLQSAEYRMVPDPLPLLVNFQRSMLARCAAQKSSSTPQHRFAFAILKQFITDVLSASTTVLGAAGTILAVSEVSASKMKASQFDHIGNALQSSLIGQLAKPLFTTLPLVFHESRIAFNAAVLGGLTQFSKSIVELEPLIARSNDAVVADDATVSAGGSGGLAAPVMARQSSGVVPPAPPPPTDIPPNLLHRQSSSDVGLFGMQIPDPTPIQHPIVQPTPIASAVPIVAPVAVATPTPAPSHSNDSKAFVPFDPEVAAAELTSVGLLGAEALIRMWRGLDSNGDGLLSREEVERKLPGQWASFLARNGGGDSSVAAIDFWTVARVRLGAATPDLVNRAREAYDAKLVGAVPVRPDPMAAAGSAAVNLAPNVLRSLVEEDAVKSSTFGWLFRRVVEVIAFTSGRAALYLLAQPKSAAELKKEAEQRGQPLPAAVPQTPADAAIDKLLGSSLFSGGVKAGAATDIDGWAEVEKEFSISKEQSEGGAAAAAAAKPVFELDEEKFLNELFHGAAEAKGGDAKVSSLPNDLLKRLDGAIPFYLKTIQPSLAAPLALLVRKLFAVYLKHSARKNIIRSAIHSAGTQPLPPGASKPPPPHKLVLALYTKAYQIKAALTAKKSENDGLDVPAWVNRVSDKLALLFALNSVPLLNTMDLMVASKSKSTLPHDSAHNPLMSPIRPSSAKPTPATPTGAAAAAAASTVPAAAGGVGLVPTKHPKIGPNSKWKKSKLLVRMMIRSVQAVHSLKKLMTARDRLTAKATGAGAGASSAGDEATKTALSFVTDELYTVDAVNKRLSAQLSTAARRLFTMQQIGLQTSLYKTSEPIVALFLPFTPGSQLTSSTLEPAGVMPEFAHFMSGLPAIGASYAKVLRDEWFGLVVTLIKTPALAAAPQTQSTILSLVNMDLEPEDIAHLANINLSSFILPLVSVAASTGLMNHDELLALTQAKYSTTTDGKLGVPALTRAASSKMANDVKGMLLRGASSAGDDGPAADGSYNRPSIHAHPITLNTNVPGHYCDVCRGRINEAYRCQRCDFDCCPNCWNSAEEKYQAKIASARAAAAAAAAAAAKPEEKKSAGGDEKKSAAASASAGPVVVVPKATRAAPWNVRFAAHELYRLILFISSSESHKNLSPAAITGMEAVRNEFFDTFLDQLYALLSLRTLIPSTNSGYQPLEVRDPHLSVAGTAWFAAQLDQIGRQITSVRPSTLNAVPSMGELDLYTNQFLFAVSRVVAISESTAAIIARNGAFVAYLLGASEISFGATASTDGTNNSSSTPLYLNPAPLTRYLATAILRFVLPKVELSVEHTSELMAALLQAIGKSLLPVATAKNLPAPAPSQTRGDLVYLYRALIKPEATSAAATTDGAPEVTPSADEFKGAVPFSVESRWRSVGEKLLSAIGKSLGEVSDTLNADRKKNPDPAAAAVTDGPASKSEELSVLLSNSTSSANSLITSLAVLAVLGGHIEPLKEGTRVDLNVNGRGDISGRITKYDSLLLRPDMIEVDGHDTVMSHEIVKLAAADQVTIDLSSLSAATAPAIVGAIVSFMQSFAAPAPPPPTFCSSPYGDRLFAQLQRRLFAVLRAFLAVPNFIDLFHSHTGLLSLIGRLVQAQKISASVPGVAECEARVLALEGHRRTWENPVLAPPAPPPTAAAASSGPAGAQRGKKVMGGKFFAAPAQKVTLSGPQFKAGSDDVLIRKPTGAHASCVGNVLVSEGIYYYEAVPVNMNRLQGTTIGWARPEFSTNDTIGNMTSYGYDVNSQDKVGESRRNGYAQYWSAQRVIGMMLRIEGQKAHIHGWFNGQDFGTFSTASGWDIPLKDGFLPAASTNDPEGIRLVFDQSEMKYWSSVIAKYPTAKCLKTAGVVLSENTTLPPYPAIAYVRSSGLTVAEQPNTVTDAVSGVNATFTPLVRPFPLGSVQETKQYIRMWSSEGTPASSDASIWRAQPEKKETKFAIFADRARSGVNSTPTNAVLICVDLTNTRDFAKPTGFVELWKDTGSRAREDCSLWMPIAPLGFVSLGAVGVKGYEPPSVDLVRCVHESYVNNETVPLVNVWKDQNSGARQKCALYEVQNVAKAMWYVSDYSEPPKSAGRDVFLPANSDSKAVNEKSPIPVSNLVVHLDATHSKYSKDTRTWSDLSAAGNDATSTASEKFPEKVEVTHNGKSFHVMRFDGQNDGMYIGDATNLRLQRPYTVFIVNRYIGSPTGRTLVGRDNGSWFLGMYSGDFSHYTGTFVHREKAPTDVWGIVACTGTSESNTCYLNGKKVNTITSGMEQPGRLALMGHSAASSEQSKCEIAHIIVYDAVLPARDITKVNMWLAGLYGMAFTLSPREEMEQRMTEEKPWNAIAINPTPKLGEQKFADSLTLAAQFEVGTTAADAKAEPTTVLSVGTWRDEKGAEVTGDSSVETVKARLAVQSDNKSWTLTVKGKAMAATNSVNFSYPISGYTAAEAFRKGPYSKATTFGSTSGDTQPWDDWNGTRGTAVATPQTGPNSLQHKIQKEGYALKTIKYWHDQRVNGLQMIYGAAGKADHECEKHYGSNDNPREGKLELGAGEAVVSISGNYGSTFMDFLVIRTNRGRSIELGRSNNNTAFNFTVPDDSLFVAFAGAQGGAQHQIGAWLCKKTAPKYNAALVVSKVPLAADAKAPAGEEFKWRVAAYLDSTLVATSYASYMAIASGLEYPPRTHAGGVNGGVVRDIGVWKFPLSPEHLTGLGEAGLQFVRDDLTFDSELEIRNRTNRVRSLIINKGEAVGALDCKGAGGYANVYNFSNCPTGDQSYTLEAWVKPTEMTGLMGVVGWGSFSSRGESNYLRLGANELCNSWYGGEEVKVVIPNLKDEWHHVACTYDAKSSPRRRTLYLDGNMVKSDTPSSTCRSVFRNFSIARTNGSEDFKGQITEVRIWREARTAAQLKEFMTKPVVVAGKVLSTNLAGYWAASTDPNLGFSNSSTLKDLSGNKLSATIQDTTKASWVKVDQEPEREEMFQTLYTMNYKPEWIDLAIQRLGANQDTKSEKDGKGSDAKTAITAPSSAGPVEAGVFAIIKAFNDSGIVTPLTRAVISDYIHVNRSALAASAEWRSSISALLPLTWNGFALDKCLDALASTKLNVESAISMLVSSSASVDATSAVSAAGAPGAEEKKLRSSLGSSVTPIDYAVPALADLKVIESSGGADEYKLFDTTDDAKNAFSQAAAAAAPSVSGPKLPPLEKEFKSAIAFVNASKQSEEQLLAVYARQSVLALLQACGARKSASALEAKSPAAADSKDSKSVAAAAPEFSVKRIIELLSNGQSTFLSRLVQLVVLSADATDGTTLVATLQSLLSGEAELLERAAAAKTVLPAGQYPVTNSLVLELVNQMLALSNSPDRQQTLQLMTWICNLFVETVNARPTAGGADATVMTNAIFSPLVVGLMFTLLARGNLLDTPALALPWMRTLTRIMSLSSIKAPPKAVEELTAILKKAYDSAKGKRVAVFSGLLDLVILLTQRSNSGGSGPKIDYKTLFEERFTEKVDSLDSFKKSYKSYFSNFTQNRYIAVAEKGLRLDYNGEVKYNKPIPVERPNSDLLISCLIGSTGDPGQWDVGLRVGGNEILFRPGYSGGDLHVDGPNGFSTMSMPFTPAQDVMHLLEIVWSATKKEFTVRLTDSSTGLKCERSYTGGGAITNSSNTIPLGTIAFRVTKSTGLPRRAWFNDLSVRSAPAGALTPEPIEALFSKISDFAEVYEYLSNSKTARLSARVASEIWGSYKYSPPEKMDQFLLDSKWEVRDFNNPNSSKLYDLEFKSGGVLKYSTYSTSDWRINPQTGQPVASWASKTYTLNLLADRKTMDAVNTTDSNSKFKVVFVSRARPLPGEGTTAGVTAGPNATSSSAPTATPIASSNSAAASGNVSKYKFNVDMPDGVEVVSASYGPQGMAWASDRSYISLSAGTYLKCPTRLPATAGVSTSTLNEYSLIIDVKIPAISRSPFTLYQTNTENSNPGEFYINNLFKMGVLSNYGGSVAVNEWQRIVIVKRLNATELVSYCQGSHAHTVQSDSVRTTPRWNISPRHFFLFASNNASEMPGCSVAYAELRPYAMTAAEVSALGRASTPVPDTARAAEEKKAAADAARPATPPMRPATPPMAAAPAIDLKSDVKGMTPTPTPTPVAGGDSKDGKSSTAPATAAAAAGTSGFDFFAAMADCTPASDAELVDAYNRLADKGDVPSPFPVAACTRYRHLSELSNVAVNYRLRVIQYVNSALNEILPMVDMALPDEQSALAKSCRQMRTLTFSKPKMLDWNRAVRATYASESGSDKNTFEFNLLLAGMYLEKKKTDWKLADTAFGQLYQQIQRKTARDRARIFRVNTNGRSFRANFKGLNSTDAGGPYRDLLDKVTAEIQSPVLPLFVPCPNQRSATGDNRDKFVPRPVPTTNAALILSGFELVGQLLGLAMRSGHLLPFNFPSIVWKQLINDRVTADDVTAIDALSFQIVKEIEDALKRKKFSSDAFDQVMADKKWTVYGADQKVTPLVPNGARISITWNNATQYIEAVNRFRLHEFDVQCAAIRRGLTTVVPASVLSQFTWQEVEKLVIGSTFDVDLLESMTTYESCAPTDSHIQLFWRMMREKFDDSDRFKFLGFVWGRSRMPASKETWGDQKFKIQRYGGRSQGSNINRFLPVTHTCFFSIELPAYTDLDAMTSRISYAMCASGLIDGDSSNTHEALRVDVDDSGESLF